MSGSIKTVHTKDAFPIAGPYSQAVISPPFVFVSGQIPGDPSGTLTEGSITDKTAACFASLKAILAASGSSLDKVVKVQVFLTDMANFAEMNAEYEKQFGGHRPARSCIAVKQLPKDVPVEIECIALV